MTPAMKSVCVFCGSRSGSHPAYAGAANALGSAIAQKGYRLVYGAGDVGLMGIVADAVNKGGGKVLGVIPKHLFDREVGKQDIDTLIVTENMHERKKVMFMNSDAFVILPGGAGSLDEFFEILTWAQLGLHEKPIFLLNVDGYWTKLLDLISHMINHKFADASLLSHLKSIESVEELNAHL